MILAATLYRPLKLGAFLMYFRRLNLATVALAGTRGWGSPYWLFCPGHEKGAQSAAVALVLQKQSLHFATAPVVYREGQLLAGEVVVPQEVSDEVDAPRVE